MDMINKLFVFMVTVGSVEMNETATNLQCYSCFGTGGNNECEQFKTYKEAMDDNKSYSHYLKNCTPPYNQSCIIETFSVLGQTVSHIRDCSDGRFFSFNQTLQNQRNAYTRLHELDNSNETACVWDGQHLVCLSKCDGDFCNGPVLERKINAAAEQGVSLTVMSALSVVGLCLRIR
ncbi:hypothetical protein MAR_004465 [Mya arenaria]|uniref:Protein quiver n=1 Tax=Mya arenaria TaxID=6604 RepID=A0ABY7EWN2_MYAAR|nr:uncharacterized protein LOC128203134 [Mya arenaria]WAR14360.1 hypothetical protein MAR_004465 [Mya arenaria]